MNRKMELLYREAEYFTVLRALLGNDLSLAEQEKLTAGWKHILTNQFHDIIPGSSIFEVYEDSKKDYEWIATQGEEVEAGFIADAVTEEASVYTVFNSNSFVRKRRLGSVARCCRKQRLFGGRNGIKESGNRGRTSCGNPGGSQQWAPLRLS